MNSVKEDSRSILCQRWPTVFAFAALCLALRNLQPLSQVARNEALERHAVMGTFVKGAGLCCAAWFSSVGGNFKQIQGQRSACLRGGAVHQEQRSQQRLRFGIGWHCDWARDATILVSTSFTNESPFYTMSLAVPASAPPDNPPGIEEPEDGFRERAVAQLSVIKDAIAVLESIGHPYQLPQPTTATPSRARAKSVTQLMTTVRRFSMREAKERSRAIQLRWVPFCRRLFANQPPQPRVTTVIKLTLPTDRVQRVVALVFIREGCARTATLNRRINQVPF